MLNGRVGQVLGPFDAGIDLLNDGAPIGEFTPEHSKPILYKLGIQTDQGVQVEINNAIIRIGKTGIYELEDTVDIKKLVFPQGAPANTIVDFIY